MLGRQILGLRRAILREQFAEISTPKAPLDAAFFVLHKQNLLLPRMVQRKVHKILHIVVGA